MYVLEAEELAALFSAPSPSRGPAAVVGSMVEGSWGSRANSGLFSSASDIVGGKEVSCRLSLRHQQDKNH